MVYIYVGLALSIWFSIAGVIVVLKPRLKGYFVAFPILMALFIGYFAGMVDEQLGYEHQWAPYIGIANGLDFYKYLFLKNWAYSIFVIGMAFTCYEVAKLWARKHKAKNPKRNVTTSEFMQDLP